MHSESLRVLLTVAFLIISVASEGLAVKFNPRGYPKRVVTCPAVNRAENRQVNIDLSTSYLLVCYCSTCKKTN